MNIVSMSDDPSGLDMEYFQQLIESKLETGQQTYIEQLAMKQMSGDVDAEGKLKLQINSLISIYKWRGATKCFGWDKKERKRYFNDSHGGINAFWKIRGDAAENARIRERYLE